MVVGSVATGNDLTDLGATPLEKETYLLCQQWNVANSVLTNRFIQPSGLGLDLGLTLLLGTLTGLMTWRWRVLRATAGVVLGAGIYVAAAAWIFVQWRWWLPVVLPTTGAMLVLHASLVTCRVLQEQRERRHVQDVFGRIVSPTIRDELLQAQRLSLGGARRELTVLFADIRGFTRLTDASQAGAEEYAVSHHLSEAAARDYFEKQSQEVLATVNLYLGAMADVVKKHNGTHDKYIGDCVMAFWGAPLAQPQHAGACVRAMVEAQLALSRLNQDRAAENDRRAVENARRASQGEEPMAPLPLLSVGAGINTGPATAGLVGSETQLLNYTVFGREVNLASRLQEIAGPGRILISDTTWQALQRDDPALAALCEEQPPAMLKGIRAPVKYHEVHWQKHGQ